MTKSPKMILIWMKLFLKICQIYVRDFCCWSYAFTNDCQYFEQLVYMELYNGKQFTPNNYSSCRPGHYVYFTWNWFRPDKLNNGRLIKTNYFLSKSHVDPFYFIHLSNLIHLSLFINLCIARGLKNPKVVRFRKLSSWSHVFF